MSDLIRDDLAKVIRGSDNNETRPSGPCWLERPEIAADAILAEFTVTRRNDEHDELITEAKKASRAVYLATDAAVANDLSRILVALVAALEAETK